MSTSSGMEPRLHFRSWLRILWLAMIPVNLMIVVGAMFFVIVGIVLLNGGTPGSLIPLPALDTWPVLLIPIFCLIVPEGGFGLYMFHSCILLAGVANLSYVIVRPNGIEVNHWPFHHLFCPWAGMSRDDGLLYSFYGLTIRMDGTQPLPDQGHARLFRRLTFRQRIKRLTISAFEGYSNGPLGDALRQNAPQLFPPNPGH